MTKPITDEFLAELKVKYELEGKTGTAEVAKQWRGSTALARA